MIALRMVRLIESHAPELAQGLLQKIQHSECASDLLKVPADELHDRTYEIYRNLSDWLLFRTDADIERVYSEIGRRRAAQGVAFSHFVWALTASKEQLWDFLAGERSSNDGLELFGELELLRQISRFFDRALYYASISYEQEMRRQALAASKRAA